MDKNVVAAKMNEILSPQKLAKEQFAIYQQYCLQVLENVKCAIIEMDASALLELVFDSPAGDGYGLDNRVIDFGFNSYMDVCEAMQYLFALQDVADGETPPDEFEDGLSKPLEER